MLGPIWSNIARSENCFHFGVTLWCLLMPQPEDVLLCSGMSAEICLPSLYTNLNWQVTPLKILSVTPRNILFLGSNNLGYVCVCAEVGAGKGEAKKSRQKEELSQEVQNFVKWPTSPHSNSQKTTDKCDPLFWAPVCAAAWRRVCATYNKMSSFQAHFLGATQSGRVKNQEYSCTGVRCP